MPFDAARAVGPVGLVAAADLDPLGARRGDARADPPVGLQIVGQHRRARPVGDVGERDRVLEHLRRRALEPEGIGMDLGAVDRDRVDHAELAELAHEGEVGIDVRVPARHLHDALRLRRPLPRLQRRRGTRRTGDRRWLRPASRRRDSRRGRRARRDRSRYPPARARNRAARRSGASGAPRSRPPRWNAPHRPAPWRRRSRSGGRRSDAPRRTDSPDTASSCRHRRA